MMMSQTAALKAPKLIEVQRTKPVAGRLWAESVKILVILNPAGYILTSSGFALFI